MEKKRRTFTNEFRARVTLEALKGVGAKNHQSPLNLPAEAFQEKQTVSCFGNAGLRPIGHRL